jgi:tripartite-type tricarboxylate transporter receptor subunit TctC
LDHAPAIETICNIAVLDMLGLDMLATIVRLCSLAPVSSRESLMSKLNAIVLAAAMAAVAIVTPAVTQAQSWPQRPVKFIVGLGPGSAQDIAARLFGDQLSKRWGQPVVIENKPGADGLIAINAFVGAHDVHTLLFAASGTFTAHPTQYAKLPYDPSDLVPLARVSSTIIAVAVPTALNINTLDELVALARKEPGKLNLAPTPGTTEITFDNFLKTANITMTKIPYSDVTKALADLAENRVQVMVSGIAIVKSQVDAGKVKLLAITNLKRAAAVPDLPTAIEAGYPALALDGLIGLFGPKSLPPGTAERIDADVQAVAADPAIGPRLAATGQQLDPGGTAEFAAAVEVQRGSIAATAKALGIQPVR